MKDHKAAMDKIARMKTEDTEWAYSGLRSISPDVLWEAIPDDVKERVDPRDFADIYEIWFLMSQEHFKYRPMKKEALAVNIKLSEFVLGQREKELEERLGLSPRLRQKAEQLKQDVQTLYEDVNDEPADATNDNPES